MTGPAERVELACNENPLGPSPLVLAHGVPFTEVAAAMPREVMVVLDEAYAECADAPDFRDGRELRREHFNTARAAGLAAPRAENERSLTAPQAVLA